MKTFEEIKEGLAMGGFIIVMTGDEISRFLDFLELVTDCPTAIQHDLRMLSKEAKRY